MGRAPIERLPGDLRPVYGLLQELMPEHPACQGWNRLAECWAQLRNRKVPLQVPVLQRELGGRMVGGHHTMHRRYFEEFKKLFDLETLGISDSMLLHENPEERNALIRTACAQHAFEWLRVQRRDDQSERLWLLRHDSPALVQTAMGPGSGDATPLDADEIFEAPVGHRFRLALSLVEESYVTILSRDPTSVIVDGRRYQPTHCLDGLIGIANRLIPRGTSVLPKDFRMDEPTGLTQTVLVAAAHPFAFPWDPQRLSQLHPTELNRFLGDLVRRGPGGFRVTTLDYHVIS